MYVNAKKLCLRHVGPNNDMSLTRSLTGLEELGDADDLIVEYNNKHPPALVSISLQRPEHVTNVSCIPPTPASC